MKPNELHPPTSNKRSLWQTVKEAMPGRSKSGTASHQSAVNVRKTDPMRLVLIAGPPRSGTTWLHRELCKGDHTSRFLPECTLLTQQVALYERTLHSCDFQRFSTYFGTPRGLMAYYQDNVVRLLSLTMSLNTSAETETLILKDPELTHLLNEIVDVLPRHNLVVLVRDPRDVIGSVKKVSQRKQQAWDLQKSVEWIYTYYRAIALRREKPDEDVKFVRYEDLVADDHGLDNLRSSLRITQMAYVGDQSEMENVRSSLDRSDPFFSDLYLKPTTKSAIGSYRAVLDDQEIALVERVFSGVMESWNYDVQ